MAERNQFVSSFRRRDPGDASDGERLALGQVALHQPVERRRRGDEIALRHGGAADDRLVADVNHRRAATAIDVGEAFGHAVILINVTS